MRPGSPRGSRPLDAAGAARGRGDRTDATRAPTGQHRVVFEVLAEPPKPMKRIEFAIDGRAAAEEEAQRMSVREWFAGAGRRPDLRPGRRRITPPPLPRDDAAARAYACLVDVHDVGAPPREPRAGAGAEARSACAGRRTRRPWTRVAGACVDGGPCRRAAPSTRPVEAWRVPPLDRADGRRPREMLVKKPSPGPASARRGHARARVMAHAEIGTPGVHARCERDRARSARRGPAAAGARRIFGDVKNARAVGCSTFRLRAGSSGLP